MQQALGGKGISAQDRGLGGRRQLTQGPPGLGRGPGVSEGTEAAAEEQEGFGEGNPVGGAGPRAFLSQRCSCRGLPRRAGYNFTLQMRK